MSNSDTASQEQEIMWDVDECDVIPRKAPSTQKAPPMNAYKVTGSFATPPLVETTPTHMVPTLGPRVSALTALASVLDVTCQRQQMDIQSIMTFVGMMLPNNISAVIMRYFELMYNFQLIEIPFVTIMLLLHIASNTRSYLTGIGALGLAVVVTALTGRMAMVAIYLLTMAVGLL